VLREEGAEARFGAGGVVVAAERVQRARLEGELFRLEGVAPDTARRADGREGGLGLAAREGAARGRDKERLLTEQVRVRRGARGGRRRWREGP
jgi:hypothetical protein